MRFNVFVSILAALVAAVDAKPMRRSTRHVVHEEQQIGRRSWSKAKSLHSHAVLPVRIGLTQQNLHRAEEFINEVAHPESPDYGKHWSRKKIIEMFAPKQESIDLVMEWLEVEGVHPSRVNLSNGKNWLSFNATVGEVEQLLKTQYHIYTHDKFGHTHFACEKYHLPEHLVDHVDIVTPTIHFDRKVGHDRTNNRKALSEMEQTDLKKRGLAEGQAAAPEHGILGKPSSGTGPKQGAIIQNALMDLQQCDRMIIPRCLQALYNTPPGTLSARNNTMGIVEYTPQAFLQSDLNLYFKSFQPDLVGKAPITHLIDNAVVQTQNKSFNFNGESALDLQFAMALIFPQTATLFQVGDTEQGASFNNFLDAIDGSYCDFQGGDSTDPNVDGQYDKNLRCGRFESTKVISTSYSYNELDLNARYEQRQCAEYMKLGLQGVSVLYSSGDFGVAGNSGVCVDPKTFAFNNGTNGIFNPTFPGTCPYVTSVGATQVLNGSSVRTPESACKDVIFSGGGFSNVFEIPSYQKKAMQDYFANHAPQYGADRFNNSRAVRGHPDVSANGANYVTAVDGNFTLSFGTSGELLFMYSKHGIDTNRTIYSICSCLWCYSQPHQRATHCSWQELYWLRQPGSLCQSFGS
jgi:tripeptidyl-peptidase-1